MEIPDAINGSFEVLGGLSALNNCRRIWIDRRVRGVSVTSQMIFVVWGVWNLYYYPHLQQWWSFVGGVVIVIANALWVALAWRFRANARAA